ncbi:MAG: hypothetical protein K2P58_14715 [Hyphomonadaceae bacterium]|nr:hypothetical protein [Hyphomonadaceae bacterium]
MRQTVLAVCVAALSACASPAGDPPAPLGVALVCSAGKFVRGGGAAPVPLPISLTVPATSAAGNFCMATGCEDARIEPTQTRALGWTALVSTNDRSTMRMELEISRDRRSFRLRDTAEDGGEWSGVCMVAGS